MWGNTLIANTGMRQVRTSLLIKLTTSLLSMSDKLASSSTMSGGCSSNILTAPSPVVAISVLKPANASCFCSATASLGWLSTMRTVFPLSIPTFDIIIRIGKYRQSDEGPPKPLGHESRKPDDTSGQILPEGDSKPRICRR
jgi:hypothetical protein